MTSIGSIAQASAFATSTALSVWAVANDFLILLILFGLLFVFARYVGRGPFVGLLLSFYAAYALYDLFPYASLLPAAPPATALFAHFGLYSAFVFLFYLILRRVAVSDFLYIGLIGRIILSFLGAAFLIALFAHLFPVTSLYQFTPAIVKFILPAKYFFWWFSAPAVGLFFFAR